LTDVAAVAALALVYLLPERPLAFLRTGAAAAAAAACFVLFFLFSVVVQFVGVNSGAAGSEWNAVPVSVDRYPDRVWPIADNQIERNLRAAYFRFFAWNIAASPNYDRGLAVRVTNFSPSLERVSEGASIEASAQLGNVGTSRLYGYDTGVYVGQMRIAVRIIDADKRAISNQYLYVQGSPAMGQRAKAIGTLTMPTAPGTYVLQCDPVPVGGDAASAGSVPYRVLVRIR
jgi:hypothetical protein